MGNEQRTSTDETGQPVRQPAVFNVNEKIFGNEQAKRRLDQVEDLLKPDNQTLSALNEQERERTRSGLEIEHIWLQFKLGVITAEEKRYQLSSKFDELEQGKPTVATWLFQKNERKLSMVERIRNKVMPPMLFAEKRK